LESRLVSFRLEREGYDWLTCYAEKYDLKYGGDPSISEAIRQIIQLERTKENPPQSVNVNYDDPYWKKFPEYVKSRRRGLDHTDTCLEMGILSALPDLADHYLAQYSKMRRSEGVADRKFIDYVLKLDGKTSKYLNKLTSDSTSWIADAVKERVNLIINSFNYWLKHPENRPSYITEQSLKIFLE
jgi:hypothetical protein